MYLAAYARGATAEVEWIERVILTVAVVADQSILKATELALTDDAHCLRSAFDEEEEKVTRERRR